MSKLTGFLIDTLLFIIGLADTSLIVLYAVEWNRYVGASFIEAGLFSIALTGGTVFLFEFGAMSVRKKGVNKGALALLTFWLILTTYSIQNTIASQYVAVQQKQEEALALANKANREQADKIDSLIAGVDDLSEAAKYRTTIKDLSAIRKDLVTTQSAENLPKKDVFQFYADILKVKRTDLVQFWLAVFKGVVLDLINILCFMFIIMRREEKNYESPTRGNRSDSTDVPPKISEELPASLERGREDAQSSGSDGPKDDVHRLAAYLYRAGGTSRNGTFISERRARDELGIEPQEYQRIVKQGLLHGVLRRSAGRTYHVAGYTETEFIREVS